VRGVEQPNAPTVGVRNGFGNGQAKPRATAGAGLRRIIAVHKALKEARAEVDRHARAVIGDL
jgi:hypothetical protein